MLALSTILSNIQAIHGTRGQKEGKGVGNDVFQYFSDYFDEMYQKYRFQSTVCVIKYENGFSYFFGLSTILGNGPLEEVDVVEPSRQYMARVDKRRGEAVGTTARPRNMDDDSYCICKMIY